MQTTATATERNTRRKVGQGPGSALVSADWLEAHLGNPQVRIVEVDVSGARHEEWHIDGAVLWDIYGDLKDAEYRLVDSAGIELLARDVVRRGAPVDRGSGGAEPLAVLLLRRPDAGTRRVRGCAREHRGGRHNA